MPRYEVKVYLSPEKVLTADNEPTKPVLELLGIQGRPTKLRMLFLDGKRRDLHAEGWDVRFRDIEGEKKLELTYKKRYPVQGDDIDAALDAAARQGFDAGESDYEAEVEWGAETPNLRLRAPVLYPTGNARHYVALDRPTGETVSSPTVTPQRQRLAAQAAPGPGVHNPGLPD